MRLIFVIAFLINAIGAMACTCSVKADFKNKDDLHSSDFIALVKIKELAPRNTVNTFMNLRVSGDIKIEIKELFKGEPTSVVYDDSYNNDCVFNLHEGEQWLFFGTIYNGKVSISKCGDSRMYSDTLGLRGWQSLNGIEQLSLLRQLFEYPVATDYANTKYYPTGKIEIQQSFRNGNLEGIRKIYYPNGQIYIIEKFKDGRRVDFRDVYTKTGQLISHVIYSNGLIKQKIVYQDTAEINWFINFKSKHTRDFIFGDKRHDPQVFVRLLDSLHKSKNWGIQIMYEQKYDDEGKQISTRFYNYDSKMKNESYMDWGKKIEERREFFEGGKLQRYSKIDFNTNRLTGYNYDTKGIKTDFDEDCFKCELNHNTSQAIPEKIYVQ